MKTYQLPQMEKGFMRKLFATLALLSLPLASQANLNCYWGDPLCWPPFIKEMEFKLGTGYRQDNFYWNVGGFEDQFNDDEGFPEIATEVMWKDLNIWTVNGELEVITCGDVLLRAEGTWGKIYHGDVRDSDYAGEERTEEFSRIYAEASKGFVYDLSATIGYRYCYVEGSLFIIPMAGFSYSTQHLHMYDGELVINVDPTTGLVGPIGDIEGSQTYKAQWRGPWIGLNLQWNVDYCFDVFAEYQYHWTEFDGLGDGDLMPEYAGDFKQHAHGKGHLFKVGGEFNFHDGWILGLEPNISSTAPTKGGSTPRQ